MDSFNQFLTKFVFLLTPLATFWCYAKRDWKSCVFLKCKLVNFEYIDSLKNNGTKHLLMFEDSFERIWSSNAVVDFATAGRHRGLSTIYLKNNLFDQSKRGRDVKLQNKHIVLFQSPRDVMQVSTLREQLRLRSELVDCYRDATSVPYGQLLIDLSPRTDDPLRYFTN